MVPYNFRNTVVKRKLNSYLDLQETTVNKKF